MKNKHSSDTIAEDMIRTFTQLVCAEGHLKTLIEKKSAELENGIIDIDNPEELNKALDLLEQYPQELNEIAEIRRAVMVKLFNMYEGDKTYWCQVKHLASASYTAFECYQASDDDAELLNMALEINKQFIKAMTHFLGVEITTCAACFGDFLKGEKEEDNNGMASIL